MEPYTNWRGTFCWHKFSYTVQLMEPICEIQLNFIKDFKKWIHKDLHEKRPYGQ